VTIVSGWPCATNFPSAMNHQVGIYGNDAFRTQGTVIAYGL
jgi:hypothetical protein